MSIGKFLLFIMCKLADSINCHITRLTKNAQLNQHCNYSFKIQSNGNTILCHLGQFVLIVLSWLVLCCKIHCQSLSLKCC